MEYLEYLFPATWKRLSSGQQVRFHKKYRPGTDARECLRSLVTEKAWLADLAAVEQAICRLRLHEPIAAHSDNPEKIRLNPSLDVIQAPWKGLLNIVEGDLLEPDPGDEYLLFWRHPRNGLFRCEVASSADLLALKIIIEELDRRSIADANAQPVGAIDRVIEKAVLRGLLLSPAAKLTRSQDEFHIDNGVPEKFLSTPAFTLQWHITQSCDLHCRHCYDRSQQLDIDHAKGLELLDQMRDFCIKHHVYGQISFSGGNPFFHPDFFTLYRAAAERNLMVAVLGNAVSEVQLRRLIAIEPPAFYQVSLEGLKQHNDEIRGQGNFDRTIDFLEVLRSHRVPSRVMLTLTNNNMGQVLPLAEFLRDKVDLFTYNRLSLVGEGASLQCACGEDYQSFIREYIEAKIDNPIIAQKDNLINIERHRQGLDLFGGCTGFGCGAAFNFVAVLPNGEIHACRKYPSPIGNLHQNSLEEIYYSETAVDYRKGSQACSTCDLRPVCGGCPAVTYGCNNPPLLDRDPACFINPRHRYQGIKKYPEEDTARQTSMKKGRSQSSR